MYKIKIHATWNPFLTDKKIIMKEDFRTTTEFKYIFNSGKSVYDNFLEIVQGDDEDYDFLVCLNMPRSEYINRMDFKKTILLYTEPKVVTDSWCRNIYGNQYWSYPPDEEFFRVFDPIRNYSMVYPFARYIDCKNSFRRKQTDELTCMYTKSNILEGHKDRLIFLRNYLYKYKNIICFFLKNNRETYNEILEEGKFKKVKLVKLQLDTTFSYKYNFNSENSYYPGYITEKLISPIYTNTLVFYNGATEVEKHIDPIFYVKLDLKTKEKRKESYDIIRKTIRDKEWEKRIDKMKKRNYDVYLKFNIFEVVKNIIKEKI